MDELRERIETKLAEVGAKLVDAAEEALTAIEAKVDELLALLPQSPDGPVEDPNAPT